MTPGLVKARLHLRYTVRAQERVDYELELFESYGALIPKACHSATDTTRLLMLEKVVEVLRSCGPKSKVEIGVKDGTTELSKRTVEQLFHRELEAVDLLI